MYLLLLLFLFIYSAFSYYPKHVKETIQNIDRDIYGVFGTYEQVNNKNRGFISNAYFVITKDAVVVFDALSTYKLGKELLETIRSVTKKPIKYVVVSHYHTDHFYGLGAFKEVGAIVIAHPWSYQYLSSEESQNMLKARRQLLGKHMEGTKLIEPDITTSESLTIHAGGEIFEIHHWCKAHTNGELKIS